MSEKTDRNVEKDKSKVEKQNKKAKIRKEGVDRRRHRSKRKEYYEFSKDDAGLMKELKKTEQHTGKV